MIYRFKTNMFNNNITCIYLEKEWAPPNYSMRFNNYLKKSQKTIHKIVDSNLTFRFECSVGYFITNILIVNNNITSKFYDQIQIKFDNKVYNFNIRLEKDRIFSKSHDDSLIPVFNNVLCSLNNGSNLQIYTPVLLLNDDKLFEKIKIEKQEILTFEKMFLSDDKTTKLMAIEMLKTYGK